MKANKAGSPVADALIGDEPLDLELDLDSEFNDTLEFLWSDDELDDEIRRRRSRRPPRPARTISRRGRSASRPRRPPSSRPGNRRPRPPKRPRPPWWPRRRPPISLRPKRPRPVLIREPAPPCICPAHGTEFIRWVQDALNRILGLRLPVDGIIGPETRSAVRKFQDRQRLTVTGLVGPDTERALMAVLGKT